MDGLRLPPLIEEALDSTGLCSCFFVALSVCVCMCVCMCLFLALHYRSAEKKKKKGREGSMFFFLIPVFTPEVRHVN